MGEKWKLRSEAILQATISKPGDSPETRIGNAIDKVADALCADSADLIECLDMLEKTYNQRAFSNADLAIIQSLLNKHK